MPTSNPCTRGRTLTKRSMRLSRLTRFGCLRKWDSGLPTLAPQGMIRRLERAGWGGRRDHFFHSFQNYFFGLLAVLKLPAYFNTYRDLAKVHFNVDPLDVWLLTAIWHDVGYGIEKINTVIEDVMGEIGSDADLGGQARAEFLKASIVQEGLRSVSSLMCRLLDCRSARTAWMPPGAKNRRSPRENQIEMALRNNVTDRSHGAASALRLYAEYMPIVKKMGPENQKVLHQIILLACCSAPFHDWHFRQCVRERCGACSIPTDAMPFAGLLAFVDSIQDDRRDLPGLKEAVSFLETLVVEAPATISAIVNQEAVRPSSLLWKLVEARDVLASLRQRPDHIRFRYPDWMVA